ncbi:MAG: zinc-ribbon domain-containing protein [Faecalibacterium sp.]|nr:zinc-ribbon domain-containing protein [Ruminococcus sp.]MCM1391527.1 zinc-ribbon domain-containing protein [Ruminococcus sp.]MCM1485515.1 zinc-ribbon domain-containing protein [Faecalibacterium sp.]
MKRWINTIFCAIAIVIMLILSFIFKGINFYLLLIPEIIALFLSLFYKKVLNIIGLVVKIPALATWLIFVFNTMVFDGLDIRGLPIYIGTTAFIILDIIGFIFTLKISKAKTTDIHKSITEKVEYCPNCGQQNNLNKDFCSNCGQSISDIKR